MAKLSERTGVGISQEIVEPLINTSESTVSDLTSFSRSDDGVGIRSISSANAIITKRVQSAYPNSSTESFRLLASPGHNAWVDAQARFPFITSATAKYGMRFTAVSTTEVDVEFGGDGAAAGDPWSNYSGWKWKLLKHRDGRTLNTTTNGIVPIGSVIAIGNSSVWSLPADGQIKDGFALCNGQAIPTGAHPLLTGNMPDLSDNRFLQGATSSGSIGGANSKALIESEMPAHTHTMAHTHGMSHTHSINHDHGSFNTSTSGHHSHPYTVNIQHSDGSIVGSESLTSGLQVGGRRRYSDSTDTVGHLHPIDVPNYTGTSGAASTSSTGAASNSTTSSTGSGTSFDIRPQYFNVVYVMRVS